LRWVVLGNVSTVLWKKPECARNVLIIVVNPNPVQMMSTVIVGAINALEPSVIGLDVSAKSHIKIETIEIRPLQNGAHTSKRNMVIRITSEN